MFTIESIRNYAPELSENQAKQIQAILRTKQYSCNSDLKDLLRINGNIGLGSIMKLCDHFADTFERAEASQFDEYDAATNAVSVDDRNSEALSYYNLGHFSAARRLWSQVNSTFILQ